MKVKDLLNRMCLWTDVEIRVQVHNKEAGTVDECFSVERDDLRIESYAPFGNAKLNTFGVKNGVLTIFAEKG